LFDDFKQDFNCESPAILVPAPEEAQTYAARAARFFA
jgi:hypothetical protein